MHRKFGRLKGKYNHSEWMKAYWKKQSKESRKKSMRKAIDASASKPRSKKQMQNIYIAQKSSHTPTQIAKAKESIKLAHSLPRTKAQLRACAENWKSAKRVHKEKKAYLKGLKIMQKLPRSEKQLVVLRKAQAITGNKPSKVQIEFSRLLKRRIPALRLDSYYIKVKGHKFRPDVVHLATSRIVEIDGAYWHNSKRDEMRDKLLGKKGYKVLHLSAKRKFLFRPKIVKRAISFLLAQ